MKRGKDDLHYSEREKAALAWTEELIVIAENHVSDELYEQTRRQFSEQEIVDLTLAVVTSNAWNRIAISYRQEVGSATTSRHRACDRSRMWISHAFSKEKESDLMMRTSARVLSIDVGRAGEFDYNGRPKSAIWKASVVGVVAARGVNLEGDEQADRKARCGGLSERR